MNCSPDIAINSLEEWRKNTLLLSVGFMSSHCNLQTFGILDKVSKNKIVIDLQHSGILVASLEGALLFEQYDPLNAPEGMAQEIIDAFLMSYKVLLASGDSLLLTLLREQPVVVNEISSQTQ